MGSWPGVWKMARDKAKGQRFALVVGGGVVLAVAGATGLTPVGDRIALEGVLPEGHPLREAWLGRPDPVETGSQNPVAYRELPEERRFVYGRAPAAAGRRSTGISCPATRSAPHCAGQHPLRRLGAEDVHLD
ncbi:hypothetical protein AB0A74_16360 [Saccharothrix sp. NPDC042600]|uniref:hypothetical protein n=1 Tax=Saccharothrix TaxID=2071 RepID=UPI0033DF8CC6|nr:hypothetical protein GCM10017745_45980 [Saccharothrix mutabilis subsp. capreolus]